jgi:polyhydroxybutyrate depolymerase
MELTAGGRVRRFALRQPRSQSRSRSNGGFPLVIVLHGNHPDATGLMMRDWTTFDEQADTFGFAVAYPDGVGGCWADGRGVTTADEAGVDDVAFLRALVGTSAERYGTFADRAVVAGVSNGAFMAHRMAIEASDQVAVFGGARSFPGAAETGPREFDAAEEICRFAEPLLAPAQSRRH